MFIFTAATPSALVGRVGEGSALASESLTLLSVCQQKACRVACAAEADVDVHVQISDVNEQLVQPVTEG